MIGDERMMRGAHVLVVEFVGSSRGLLRSGSVCLATISAESLSIVIFERPE